TISANAIGLILKKAIPALAPTSTGVRIAGATISGELQLQSLRIPYPFELIECHVEEPINLIGANLDSLDLSGSRIGRLNAESLKLSSGVFLSNGFVAKDEVCLRRVHVGGDLSCIGGQFDHPRQLALNAEGAIINGHVLLSNGLTVNGQVNLT